jgi:hypothetical protein
MTIAVSSASKDLIGVFVSYSRKTDPHRQVGRRNRLEVEPDLHIGVDEYDLPTVARK